MIPADTVFSLANPGHEPFEAVVVLPVGGQAAYEGRTPSPRPGQPDKERGRPKPPSRSS